MFTMAQKNNYYKTGIVVVLMGVFFSAHAFAFNLERTLKDLKKHKAVSNELIVKQKEGNSKIQIKLFEFLDKKLGTNSVLSVSQFQLNPKLHKIILNKKADLKSALIALNQLKEVEYAEPNYILEVNNFRSNDPMFNQLWGMKNTGQRDVDGQYGKVDTDINVVPLWEKGITGSRDIKVAIIDTGVQWNHPDLKANIYTNPSEIDGNGIDDDGNGFVDDVHGWNFITNTGNSNDDHDHGTHCAGTIGGVGNNGIGVAGVNWAVSILPLKFLSADGSGTLEAAVEAIQYATLMQVNVMSNSWGGGGFSQTMYDAIEAASTKGILFVAAAGNDGKSNDSDPSYPASYENDNVVSVAAIDNAEKLAYFSNYGSKTVDVAAPGVNILSTVKDGKYVDFSGTSMATPHVSGVAALLFSANPSWTHSDVKQRLIATSKPVRVLRRKVASKGMVDAFNAYQNVIPPPTDPDESLWEDVSYSLESSHPYLSNAYDTFNINYPGAKYIRVHFAKIEVEEGYDKLELYSKSASGKKELVESFSGEATNYMSDYAEGGSFEINLTTDGSVDGYGFMIDRIQVIR